MIDFVKRSRHLKCVISGVIIKFRLVLAKGGHKVSAIA